jgi:hypothetical protein
MTQLKTFGNWNVYSSGSDYFAMALNSNEGEYIAFYCYSKTKQCMHSVSLGIKCINDSRYPILVNSNVSAITLDGVCSNISANSKIVFFNLTSYDSIHLILEQGIDVGFALPLESGRFKVSRFNLNGSAEAMNYTQSLVLNGKLDSEIM